MQFQNLRDCTLATLILLTCMTVTDAQRSISFHSTLSIPPKLPLKQIVDVVTNDRAFAALTRDGSVFSWGSSNVGGRLDASVSALTNVKSIFAVGDLMLGALTQDDTMYMWGYKPVAPITNAKAIFVTQRNGRRSAGYAVLRKDGSVVTDGENGYGGDSSSVASELNNVKHIAANDYAFAAIRENGSVVTWGKSDSGGDSSSVNSLLVDVVEIVSNTCAFAALTSNGDVVSWGCSWAGGSVNMYRAQDVKSIYPITNGFLGIHHNGSVVGWGTAKALDNSNGLDLNSINVTQVIYSDDFHDVCLQQPNGSIAILTGDGVSSPLLLSQLSKDVKTIVTSKETYIALKHDGSTVMWYNSRDGIIPSLFEDVVVDSIYPFKKLDDWRFSFENGFVAVAHGDNRMISRAHDLSFDSTKYVPNLSKLVVSGYGVTVLTHDGDVESWSHTGLGSIAEYVPDTNVKDIRSASESILYLFNDGSFKAVGEYFPSKTQITKMSIGISKIFSTTDAFAALLTDGTVVAWGEASHGGDTSLVTDKLNNVKMVYQNYYAFAALKYDGTVASWGHENFGGNSDSVATLLKGANSIVPLSKGYGFAAIMGDRLISWGGHNFPSHDMKFDGNVTGASCGWDLAPACTVSHGNDTVTLTTTNDRVTGVKSVVQSYSRYALLLKNGEVIHENPEEIVDIQSQLVNVKSLYSSGSLFADSLFVALKHDHTVVLFPESEFGGNYNKITQYLSANTVLSIQTTERHFVAITKHLDGFVDEYVVFNDFDFMVVKDCRCELEVHDEFVLETSFRPTASPTSSPTVSPTSSPTSPTDSQLQENDNNSGSLYIGIGVGAAAGLVIVAAMVAYRKYFLSPHKASDVVLEKSLSSDNPSFQA